MSLSSTFGHLAGLSTHKLFAMLYGSGISTSHSLNFPTSHFDFHNLAIQSRMKTWLHNDDSLNSSATIKLTNSCLTKWRIHILCGFYDVMKCHTLGCNSCIVVVHVLQKSCDHTSAMLDIIVSAKAMHTKVTLNMKQ